MPAINLDSVRRLFANAGFTYSFGLDGSSFAYETRLDDGKPLNIKFAAQWLKADPLAEYDLDAVRRMLTGMVESARGEVAVRNYLSDQGNVDLINDAMLRFGMTYSEEDGQFYYVRDGKALFGVDHDYIASLICTGKAKPDTLGDTLADMLETAEYEAGEAARPRKMDGSAE